MGEFEWDPAKERANLTKHNTPFSLAVRIWEGKVVERIDNRRAYGETRIQAFGEIDSRLMSVIYTWRDTKRRIISARKANQREKRFFEAAIRGC
jgi:uncharacterized DUF497 family protein